METGVRRDRAGNEKKMSARRGSRYTLGGDGREVNRSRDQKVGRGWVRGGIAQEEEAFNKKEKDFHGAKICDLASCVCTELPATC